MSSECFCGIFLLRWAESSLRRGPFYLLTVCKIYFLLKFTLFRKTSVRKIHTMKVRELLSSRGRIGRLCYLGLTILVGVTFELGSVLIPLLVSVVKPDWSFAGSVCLVVSLAFFCIYLGFILIVKRLHDVNISGWYCFFTNFSFMLGILANEFVRSHSLPIVWTCVAVALLLISLLVGFVLNIMLVFRPGTKGPNRFGERASTFRELFRKPV